MRKSKALLSVLALLPLVFLFQNCGEEEFNSVAFNSAESTSLEADYITVGDMIVHKNLILKEDLEKFWPEKVGEESSSISTFGAKVVGVKLWPNGTVPIVFDSNIPIAHRNLFMTHCSGLSAVANIKCVHRKTQTDYLRIRYASDYTVGGYSYYGRKGGEQLLWLGSQSFGDGSFPEGTIVQHELMHALGIAHEQTRIDRDNHVIINWANTKSHSNFVKMSKNTTRTSFDFNSIMIYDSFRSSINPSVPSMTRKNPVGGSNLIALNYFLSPSDKKMLQLLYGTKNTVRVSWPNLGPSYTYSLDAEVGKRKIPRCKGASILKKKRKYTFRSLCKEGQLVPLKKGNSLRVCGAKNGVWGRGGTIKCSRYKAFKGPNTSLKLTF